MNLKRKKHLLPYALLLIIHSVLLFYTFYKNKDRKRLFILLVSNIGLAYFFEYFVVNLFNGYSYKPGVFKNNYIDKIMGAILSQAIYVPFTALFITAFRLGWKYKLVTVIYFGVVEAFYVRLGIYTHMWWRTIYTVFLLPIYFFISDKWYEQLKKGNPAIQFFSLYHFIVVTCVNVLFIKAVRNKVKFGRGYFHSWREHFILVPLYSMVIALFSAWQLKDSKGYNIGKVMGFQLIIDNVLERGSWLKVNGEHKLNHYLSQLTMSILSIFYRDLVYKNKANS
ncbi:hypothetical protein DS745_12035 [Anaerobacillus alkaliphilus]|uniref:Uncharacterized protein n=1 Tax=Anaerobacillus alkaliphilus TaxID=1548597 RepID=A0A4Q0VSH1_9BACI|nr:hypothetical protein [Anaerobacillus alkaliphilus]RXJ00257.1 hypothetical protein DS745_12035 [Anaerobacillus alkaliphilus]